MVNPYIVNILVNQIKQKAITVDDIKIQEYKDAVTIALTALGLDGNGNPIQQAL